MIAHYRKQFGFTAILISHDIPDVFFISDRILLLWEGKIAFHGTYEELTKLKHPMIDEFLQSIEGLRDELSGLLSKEMFRSRYALTLGGESVDSSVTAVLFGIQYDSLAATLGPQTAFDILKSLGEHVNKYCVPMGGFSARHGIDTILTILPRIDILEAGQLVHTIAEEFNTETIAGTQSLVRYKAESGTCFEILVTAGMTKGSSTDTIEQIIEKAELNKEIIVKCRCGKEDGLQ
jgi:phospholipid/cholesterol/gamma-HCH transport system ATP-binding protein